MKVIVLLCVCIATVLAKPSPQKYTTKYDNMDIDEILNSDRLLTNYVNCLMDRGPCTPEGKELKSNAKDAMETDCSKCSEKQREGSRKVFNFIIKNKHEIFEEVSKKYDPEGKYKIHYCERAKEENIDSAGACD